MDAFKTSLEEQPADKNSSEAAEASAAQAEIKQHLSCSVYERVTQAIIKELEAGRVPWIKPWKINGQYPQNLLTKKPYRGFNQLVLSGAVTGFNSPYYVTMRQANQLGGRVKAGEKAQPIIFWKKQTKTSTNKSTGELEEQEFFIARYYLVFNVEQTDIPADKIPAKAAEQPRQFKPIEEAARIAAAYPGAPVVKHGGSAAYYNPGLDYIQLPAPEAFISDIEYYSTLNHELIHSTGHTKRLNRLSEKACFGNGVYSQEELAAEFGSAYLNHEAGIGAPVIKNQAAYIQSWLQKIREQPKALVIAASQAERAALYILNKKKEEA